MSPRRCGRCADPWLVWPSPRDRVDPRGRRGPDEDFRFAAAVAAFGMILGGSEHRGAAALDQVLELARGSMGEDAEGYRAEFVQMVERARRLQGAAPLD